MTLTYTPRFHLAVPDFLSEPWHDEFAAAMQSIDQALFTAIVAQNASTWIHEHTYALGDIVIDPTTGTLYSCAVAHTSSSASTAPTFADELALHPTFWTSFAVTAATQVEAEQGIDNSKYMTPLRTSQAIFAQSPTPGVATVAQAQEQLNNTEIMTPLRVGQGITARIASNAQALAGADNTVLMTPLRTEQLIASTGVAGGNQIAFSAHKNSVSQTGIVSGTTTKVTFGTELYDLGSVYDTANSRWTPPSGVIHIEGVVNVSGVTVGSAIVLQLQKNGALLRQGVTVASATSDYVSVEIDDTANGTDFYELFINCVSASTASVNGIPATTYFMGHFLGQVGTVTLGAGQIGFRANKNGVSQNIPNAVYTKVTFGFEDYDQGSRFDVVNSRWTPPTGLVHLDAGVYFAAGATGAYAIAAIYKNGAILKQAVVALANPTPGSQISLDDSANGTDYYELFVNVSSGSVASLDGSVLNTWFGGHFLGGSQGATGPIGPTGPDGAVTAPAINCGRLRFVSATLLSFTPFNGDRIKINGVLVQIPSAGIVGLANTGVFVNSVAGQNLVANGTYYVYAFLNAGVVTADFSTTGHATSATAGNMGTEIKIGDDTRTLIGMIHTVGTTFVDTPAARMVLSWFNRRARSLRSPTGTNTYIGVGSWTTINGASYVAFLTWGDEACQFGLWGYAYVNDTGAAGFYAGYAIDQGVSPTAYSYNVNNPGWGCNIGMSDAAELAEGFHNFYPMGYAGSYTTYFNIILSGIIRG